MEKRIEIKTIEELVKYALQERGRDKFQLDYSTHQEYVNKQAGKVWEAKYWTLPFDSKERKEWWKQQPAQVTKEAYQLRRASGSWNSFIIALS
jgi:hypothetical protein